MHLLTAEFKVPIKNSIVLRVKGKSYLTASRVYKNRYDGFDVSVIIKGDGGGAGKKKGEYLWTAVCNNIIISLTKSIDAKVPETEKLSGGSIGYEKRYKYLNNLLPAYSKAASCIANNVVRFIKYELHQPIEGVFSGHEQFFQNPIWKDEKGVDIRPGGHVIVLNKLQGVDGELGTIKIEGKHKHKFELAIINHIKVKLYNEILSDAQMAVFEGNIRRAVLELAISLEIFAKHKFLIGDSNATKVYEYFEDKGKINIQLLELINIGCSMFKGVALKDHDSAMYQQIDYIIRTRNKIAHRGEPIFKDTAGKQHAVDEKIIVKWFDTINKFYLWAS